MKYKHPADISGRSKLDYNIYKIVTYTKIIYNDNNTLKLKINL